MWTSSSEGLIAQSCAGSWNVAGLRIGRGGRGGKGRGSKEWEWKGVKGERGEGKEREGSTWIVVDGPPSC